MDITVDNNPVFAGTGGKEFVAGKQTVVFIHGAAMDHTVWSLQSRYFAHHDYSVLAVDLPGHGKSGGDAIPTIAGMADWVGRLAEEVDAGLLHLVGHSMGGLIALDFAARYGDKVASVSMLGAAPVMPVNDGLLSAARANNHQALESIIEWGVGRRAQMGGHIAPGAWVAGAGLRLIERVRPGVLANDFSACNDYQDGLERAGQVTCPVMLLMGEDDRMTPPRANGKMIGILQVCTPVTLKAAGHMMMVEQPDETLDALASFLKSSGNAGA